MPTFTLISAVTVGAGGASSISFSSIPSTYTDLVVKLSLRDTTSGQPAQNLNYSINGSTSSFSGRWVGGNGSAPINGTWSAPTIGAINAAGSTSNTFGSMEIYFPNYAVSGINKSHSSDSVTENNGTTSYTWFDANLWSNTSAITSISFANAGQTFVQYSTAYLYGVSNA